MRPSYGKPLGPPMADVLTPKQRRYCMSRIRGKDTKPELRVRSLVHSLGYRYRLHVRTLPGSPDLVFASRRKVVFVHGCFWHCHNCRYGKVEPQTRARFWESKLERNRERDQQNVRRLRRGQWDVLVVWECQTRNADRLGKRLVRFLENTQSWSNRAAPTKASTPSRRPRGIWTRLRKSPSIKVVGADNRVALALQQHPRGRLRVGLGPTGTGSTRMPT